MASIEVRIALPMAVRRPVVRPAMASSSTSRSSVGGWMISANPAKATTPTAVAVWRSMNREAAACATSSRLGAMSVAHMLRETSIAKITVAWPVGTEAMTTGRASARARLASPTANSANGRCRRIRDLRGSASRTNPREE